MTDPVLDVSWLVKSYRVAYETIAVMKGLSPQGGANELVAIMGPSGRCKTTMLNCFATSVYPAFVASSASSAESLHYEL